MGNGSRLPTVSKETECRDMRNRFTIAKDLIAQWLTGIRDAEWTLPDTRAGAEATIQRLQEEDMTAFVAALNLAMKAGGDKEVALMQDHFRARGL